MPLEIPELLKPNTANVDNVVALRDGRLWVATRDHGTKRSDESCQILVQGE